MQCIGRNRNLNRCRNNTPFLFCKTHNKQWIFLLFITIPTLLTLYYSVYKDFILPCFHEKETVLSKEFEVQQSKAVLDIFSHLSNVYYNFSVLINDEYVKTCYDSRNLGKADNDFFVFNTQGTLFELKTKFFNKSLNLKPICIKAVFLGDRDSLKLNDTMQYCIEVQLLPMKCVFDFRKPIFFKEENILEPFRSWKNSIYTPSLIKGKMEFFANLNFTPISLNKCSKTYGAFFLLESLQSNNLKTEFYIFKNIENSLNTELRSYKNIDGVFEVNYELKQVSAFEFLTRINDLHNSTTKWLNDNNVKY